MKGLPVFVDLETTPHNQILLKSGLVPGNYFDVAVFYIRLWPSKLLPLANLLSVEQRVDFYLTYVRHDQNLSYTRRM